MSNENRPGLSRRQFLSRSAAVAGGAWVALNVPWLLGTGEGASSRGTVHAADLLQTPPATPTPRALTSATSLGGGGGNPTAAPTPELTPSPNMLTSNELAQHAALIQSADEITSTIPLTTTISTPNIETTAPLSGTIPIDHSDPVTDTASTEAMPISELTSQYTPDRLPWQELISSLKENKRTDAVKIALAAMSILDQASDPELDTNGIRCGDNIVGTRAQVVATVRTRTSTQVVDNQLMKNRQGDIESWSAGDNVHVLGIVSGTPKGSTWVVASNGGKMAFVAADFNGTKYINLEEDQKKPIPFLDTQIVSAIQETMSPQFIESLLPIPDATPLDEVAADAGIEHMGIMVNAADKLGLVNFAKEHFSTVAATFTWGHHVSLNGSNADVTSNYTSWIADSGAQPDQELVINHCVFPGGTRTSENKDWFQENPGLTHDIFVNAVGKIVGNLSRNLNRTKGAILSVVNEPGAEDGSTGRTDGFGDRLGYGDYSDPDNIISGYIDQAFQAVTDRLKTLGLTGKVKRAFSETAKGMITGRTNEIIQHLQSKGLVDVVFGQAHEKYMPLAQVAASIQQMEEWGLPWRISELSGGPTYLAAVTKLVMDSENGEGIHIWEDENFSGSPTVVQRETGESTPGFEQMYGVLAEASLFEREES